MSSRSCWVWTERSVPLGRYWRTSPFQFSLVPRCQGECGSQKNTGMLVFDREAGVIGELAALVPGQRAGQLDGQVHHVLGEASGHMVGVFGVDLDEHAQPGGPLDQGGHVAAPVASHDQVTLPVAGHGPVSGLGWALGDVDHRPDGGTRAHRPTLGPTTGPPRPQPDGQLLAQLTFALDVEGLIDRLVRHPPLWIVGMIPSQPPADLFRGALLTGEHGSHLGPQPRPLFTPPGLGSASRLIRPLLSAEGPIPPSTPVGGDLPTDRAPMPAQAASDHHVGVSPLDPDPDLLTLSQPEGIGSRLTVAQHDHSLFPHPLRQRGNPDPRLLGRHPPRHPTRHRHQRREHHRPRQPRTPNHRHHDTPHQKLSRSPLELTCISGNDP